MILEHEICSPMLPFDLKCQSVRMISLHIRNKYDIETYSYGNDNTHTHTYIAI